MEVEENDTIETIKGKILDIKGYPSNKLILIFMGKNSEDDRRIIDYNIQNESTIASTIKLRGQTYHPIYIRRGEQMTEIEVCFCYPVKLLKKIIREKIGIKPEVQN